MLQDIPQEGLASWLGMIATVGVQLPDGLSLPRELGAELFASAIAHDVSGRGVLDAATALAALGVDASRVFELGEDIHLRDLHDADAPVALLPDLNEANTHTLNQVAAELAGVPIGAQRDNMMRGWAQREGLEVEELAARLVHGTDGLGQVAATQLLDEMGLTDIALGAFE